MVSRAAELALLFRSHTITVRAIWKLRNWGGRLGLAAQTASLAATAWVMWRVWFGPQSAGQPFGHVLAVAMGFTLFAWLWSAVIALVLHLAIARVERVDIVGATLRTSAVAVWFAPATMLLTSISPWAVPAALVLVVNATRLLYAQWQLIDPPDARSPGLPRHFGPALAVSTGLQAGLAAELMRKPHLAAAFLTMSAAVMTVFAISAGVWDQKRQPSLPRSVFGLILTLILATGMSVIGVSGGSGWGFGFGGSGDGSIVDLFKRGQGNSDRPSAPEKAPPKAAPARSAEYAGRERYPDTKRDPTSQLAGSFPGVILWPEVKPVTLVVPLLPSTRSGRGIPARPFSIPFGGEYWMYRSLIFKRPPRNSFLQRGTPANLSFSTTDRWPLQMEAHQKLEQPIDPACCATLQLEILNADRYPGTVSLEVRLISNEDGTTTSQSLGQRPVLSRPNLSVNPVGTVGETLEFPMPGEPTLHRVDELEVVFQRARVRADKSARISIERFVLTPR